jgi:hypothetical protein
MLSPIGVRGSSDAYGSWKMTCIRRRYGLSALPFSRDVDAVEDDRAGVAPGGEPCPTGLAAGLTDQPGLPAAGSQLIPADGLDIGDRPLEDAAPG